MNNKYIIFFVLSSIVIIIIIFAYIILNNKGNKEKLKNFALKNTSEIKKNKILKYDKVVKNLGHLSKGTGGGGSGKKNYQGIYFMDTGEKIEGQRDPNKRLDLISKHISFKNKTILDIGCNSGEMLFNLLKYKIKYGLGLDFDPYKINMCNLMKRYNNINNIDFFIYNIKNESTNNILSLLPGEDQNVDIVFLLAVCQAWIYPCNYLINDLFNISNTLVIEINGSDDKKIELVEYLKKLYNSVKEITDTKYCKDCAGRRLFIATDKKNIVFGNNKIAAIEFKGKNVKKIFSDKIKFEKEKYWLNLLQKYDFIPKIINIDNNNLEIEMENCGSPVDINNRPSDFNRKLEYIQKSLNKDNLYHNDIHRKNLLVRPDNTLCLIDYDWMSKKMDDPFIIKKGPYGKAYNNKFLNTNLL
jgi:SAM-dependent methyltransferase